MKIRNKLYIGAAISIALAIILVVVVVLSSNKVAREMEKHHLATDMSTAVLELNILTHEYLLNRENRMEQQWILRYKSMEEVLEEAEKNIRLPLSMLSSYTTLYDSFSQVTANSKEIQRLTQEGASQEKIDTITGLEERLVAQLLITSHSVITDASRLAEEAEAGVMEAQRVASNLALSLMAILAITVTTSSLIIARNISKPLDELTRGAEMIGKGELEHNVEVKSQDELGQLAASFNKMTENLKKVTASRDDLDREVTERKRAEEEIKAQKEFTDYVIDSLRDTFYIFDPESGKGIQWNKTLNEISGYDYKKMSEYPPSHFYPPEEHQLLEEAVETTLEKGHALVEVTYITADGTRIPFEYSLTRIKDAEGKTRICVIGRDVTERKQAEEALPLSEEKLRHMFQSATDGIAVVDLTGVITESNDRMVEMHGLGSKEELLGRNAFDFIAPRDQEKAMKSLQAVQTQGAIEHFECAILKADGAEFPGELSAGALRDDSGNPVGVVAITRDGTERKQAEEELKKHRDHLEELVEERTVEIAKANEQLQQEIKERKQAQKELQQTVAELERSNAELERFAYVASHDLQEPLRMVASYTQLLEKRYKDKLDADANEFINYAVGGAKRMQQLINDLLTYSRVGTRGKPLEPTDCAAVLNAAVANLDAAIRDNGAEVTCDTLPAVMADEGQLVQLFQNLIDNGIKFRGEGSPCIHISAEHKDSQWVFSVRDNGIGIDPQYFERLFIVFQRLHGAEYPGTGLGLYVSREIIEAHGGRIWVESKVGRGSTFTFTLPLDGIGGDSND